jgi:hypothetical protein
MALDDALTTIVQLNILETWQPTTLLTSLAGHHAMVKPSRLAAGFLLRLSILESVSHPT